MIKSELIQRIADHNPHLYPRDVENIVNAILDEITAALARGDSMELSGFDTVSVKKRRTRRLYLGSSGSTAGRAIADHSVILTIAADGPTAAIVGPLLEQAIRVGATLEGRRQEEAIAKLADAMLPDERLAVRSVLAMDNLQIRDRFLATERSLARADVGAQAGHSRTNPYATAARWKKSGAIFSVQHRGAEHFPAFQFRDGKPHPTIKKTLAALPARLSPWQIAMWFVSTNGWLDDAAPVDVLDDEAAIAMAAAHESEEVMG